MDPDRPLSNPRPLGSSVLHSPSPNPSPNLALTLTSPPLVITPPKRAKRALTERYGAAAVPGRVNSG
jgi:hypothetical protein